MQQTLLPVNMSNFNQKSIKIITNLALAKAGLETLFQSEGNFQHLN